MILGVGCDMLEIARVRRLWLRYGSRMQARLFTSSECIQAAQKVDVVPRYAKYISAKEAVYKALPSSAQQGFSWHDAEVLYGAGGKPEIALSEKILNRLPIGVRVHLSLSDSESLALAYVVIEAA